MYKRDTKVICKGEQWYYIGQDSAGDHLLSKKKGYTGANDCTNAWFGTYDWTFTSMAYEDGITLVEPTPTISPLENAIIMYKREHGIIGTRPFKVLQEYQSTWYRFNGSTLEYEHINGWNKALASTLCLVLFNTNKFLYLKGEEPRVE